MYRLNAFLSWVFKKFGAEPSKSKTKKLPRCKKEVSSESSEPDESETNWQDYLRCKKLENGTPLSQSICDDEHFCSNIAAKNRLFSTRLKIEKMEKGGGVRRKRIHTKRRYLFDDEEEQVVETSRPDPRHRWSRMQLDFDIEAARLDRDRDFSSAMDSSSEDDDETEASRPRYQTNACWWKKPDLLGTVTGKKIRNNNNTEEPSFASDDDDDYYTIPTRSPAKINQIIESACHERQPEEENAGQAFDSFSGNDDISNTLPKTKCQSNLNPEQDFQTSETVPPRFDNGDVMVVAMLNQTQRSDSSLGSPTLQLDGRYTIRKSPATVLPRLDNGDGCGIGAAAMLNQTQKSDPNSGSPKLEIEDRILQRSSNIVPPRMDNGDGCGMGAAMFNKIGRSDFNPGSPRFQLEERYTLRRSPAIGRRSVGDLISRVPLVASKRSSSFNDLKPSSPTQCKQNMAESMSVVLQFEQKFKDVVKASNRKNTGLTICCRTHLKWMRRSGLVKEDFGEIVAERAFKEVAQIKTVVNVNEYSTILKRLSLYLQQDFYTVLKLLINC